MWRQPLGSCCVSAMQDLLGMTAQRILMIVAQTPVVMVGLVQMVTIHLPAHARLHGLVIPAKKVTPIKNQHSMVFAINDLCSLSCSMSLMSSQKVISVKENPNEALVY